MNDPLLFLAVAGTFLLAGAVKGVIGLGLPTVSLGLLTLLIDLPSAMALLLVPSFVTNLWQAAVGGKAVELLRRLWLFLLLAAVSVWIGAAALTRLDLGLLSALLGVLLIVYAGLGLGGVRVSLSRGQETWSGPVFGIVNGVLTGMTGSFVVPGVLFLQAIGLSRDELVQAMGILFTVSTFALALALQGNALLTAELSLISAAALIPALIGMAAGQQIRHRLPETRFRQVFFLGLFLLGLVIVWNAL